MSGLTGHIDHLYEDPNLKLEDIVRIYRSIAEKRDNIKVYEKVDGYNVYLSFSAKDKKARLIRNNSQIKSGGITLADLKEEFVTKRLQTNKKPVPTNVVKAYTDLIGFFEKIVSFIFPAESNLRQIFGEDKNGNPQFFFNVEIIDPDAPNIIKYSREMLIFHKLGNVKIDSEKGVIEAVDTDEVKLKYDEVSKIFGKSNDARKIEIAEDKESQIDLVDLKLLDKELGLLRSEFKKLGLDMKDTIGKLLIKKIENNLKEKKLNFDNFETEFIVKSILSVGFGSKHLKKPRLNETFPRPDAPKLAKIKELTNEEPAKELFKMLRSPIEKIMFNCSAILLDKYESIYLADNKQTGEDIIQLVNNAIENINSKGNTRQKNNLSKNIEKLQSAAIGFNELINNPVEGIVFNYNNHTYKITSSFGPVNQIIHMSKFELDSLNESKTIEANGIKVLFAGAFKPPHKGHIEVIKNFVRLPKLNNKNFKTEKVIVFIGSKPRYSKDNKEFDIDQSIKLLSLYVKVAGLEDIVELRATGRDNPVKDVYDYIANSNNDPDKAQSGDVILLGVSQKDKGYYSNLAKFVKDKPWQIIFGEDYEVPMVFKSEAEKEQDLLSEFSSTQFRDAISNNDTRKIDSFLPEEILSSQELKNKVYNILGVQPTVEEIKENKIINLINSKLSKQINSPKLNLGDLINRVNSIYNK